MKDIRFSFEYLFPKVNVGGVYLIEDLHTSFWRSAGGGFRNKRNFLNYMTHYVFSMHHWYHHKIERPTRGMEIKSLQIYDSIVAFKKGKGHFPVHSQVGKI